MGIWIELRCDAREQPTGYAPKERCFSAVNDGPSGMVDHRVASALSLLRRLEKDAKALGWKKTREGWVCPHCASVRAGVAHMPPAATSATAHKKP